MGPARTRAQRDPGTEAGPCDKGHSGGGAHDHFLYPFLSHHFISLSSSFLLSFGALLGTFAASRRCRLSRGSSVPKNFRGS